MKERNNTKKYTDLNALNKPGSEHICVEKNTKHPTVEEAT